MSSGTASLSRNETSAMVLACAGLMVLSALLGASFNALRPPTSRLPWKGDWDRHAETLAFRAGIPVTFLLGARERFADSATVAFDARTPAEYAAGHIAGAFSLPVADVDARLAEHVHRLTPDTPILVYCGGADCTDGLDLALKLRELGFNDLTLYPGGFAEWKTYGGAIREGETP